MRANSFVEMSPVCLTKFILIRYPEGLARVPRFTLMSLRCPFDLKLSPVCHLPAQDSRQEPPTSPERTPMPLRPLAFFAAVALVAVGCTRTDDAKPSGGSTPAPAAEKSNITVKGSDTM